MDNKKRTLQDIFDEEDEFGLLNIKPSNSPARNADERLVSSFQEINDFYEKHKREPQEGKGVQEHTLYARLKSIRENPTKADTLREYDTSHLLGGEAKTFESLDDILDDDDWDLLEDDTEELFEFKHIKRPHERAETDFVAQRKPCKNFAQYEHLFKGVQKDFKEKKRQLVAFKQENLRAGDFYIHNGILLYLENVDSKEEVQQFKSGSRTRKDGRTRIIFENGTESNMLYRSLYKALLVNGKAVSRNENEVAETLAEVYNNITEEDKAEGYIYILKSKSEKPEIKSIKNLYKIGYSTTRVEERIKNAAQQTTYLMADVEIKATYKCFNMSPQRFEQLIHTFFGKVCLNVDVFDNRGQRYTPREWFIAPLGIIDQVIELIVSGKIVDYRYDEVGEDIVRR
jgi:hypothetical protein